MKPQSAQRKTLCSPGEFPLKEITNRIISCAIEVHSALGPGLLENVYEEALSNEFKLRKIIHEKQKEISLKYKGKDIGKHRIDYLVENEVVLALKAAESMNKIYEAQLLTYLKAMNKRVGLLINFNVERLKEGIKLLIIQENTEGGNIFFSFLVFYIFSVFSVVTFISIRRCNNE